MARQQLNKYRSVKRTKQGQWVEARNVVDLIIMNCQLGQQMKIVQRSGATQDRTSNKQGRTDMNKIQVAQRKSKETIVEDNLCGTSFSQRQCVSSELFILAGLAKQFNRLYLRIKREASKTMTPGSVFAKYDTYSRRWVHNLVAKRNDFHELFHDSLKKNLVRTRKKAEKRGVSNIRIIK